MTRHLYKMAALFYYPALFSLVFVKYLDAAAVYTAGCAVNEDLYIEDDTDAGQFWRCHGLYSTGVNFPNPIRCQPRTCVPKGFGVHNDTVPCGWCDGVPWGPARWEYVADYTPVMGSAGAGQAASLPPYNTNDAWSCDFSNDECGIISETSPVFPFDDYKFKRLQGPQGTPSSGPSTDKNGDGYYFTAIGNDGPTSGTTSARTTRSRLNKQFSGATPLSMTFAYHMYGNNVERLRILIRRNDSSTNLIWNDSGNKGDVWLDGRVMLPGGVPGGYEVLLEAVSGNGGNEADIALDAIDIQDGLTYPIPANGCDNLGDNSADGWYHLQIGTPPAESYNVHVWCDMDFKATVFSRRVNGDLSFDRTWAEYKAGFGSPLSSYWMSMDALSYLTRVNPNNPYRLDVKLTDTSGNRYEFVYTGFRVGTEAELYPFSVVANSYADGTDSILNPGTSSWSMNGIKFTTKDRDNDNTNINLAQQYKSGWWYNQGWAVNLNAPYNGRSCGYGECMGWKGIGDGNVPLATASMSLLS